MYLIALSAYTDVTEETCDIPLMQLGGMIYVKMMQKQSAFSLHIAKERSSMWP